MLGGVAGVQWGGEEEGEEGEEVEAGAKGGHPRGGEGAPLSQRGGDTGAEKGAGSSRDEPRQPPTTQKG